MGLLRRATVAQYTDAPFTYAEVGGTRSGALPAGYHLVERSAVVGSGRVQFDRAAAAVFRWDAQRGAGLRIRADGPASTVGTVVLMTAGLRRAGLDIPCRVVWVVDEPDRRGFGYGTLPGHPETGEEAFVVGRAADGTVTLSVVAYAGPGLLLTRLAGPVAWWGADQMVGRYAEALRH